MTSPRARAPLPGPDRPLSLDEVLETYPTVRQSWLAHFDDCALSSYFEMRFRTADWNVAASASGVIFHRFAGACLRELREMDSEVIPQGVALAILEETLEQRGVPPRERVRVPLREVRNLRWIALKFARDNSFSVRHIIDVEKRLEASLEYVDDEGQKRARVLSGQPDALIADPADPEGAILIDWKSGWGLPPERREDEEDVSYHGLFQLYFYGWLVMRCYPAVERVTLREFYPRRTEARTASIEKRGLPQIEKMLADIILELDRCLATGKPRRLRFPDVAPWNPSPGKHCEFCAAPQLCPIESAARERYAVTSKRRAEKAVAELQVAEAVRKARRDGLRPYIEEHGPQPAKWSRGRRVFGLRTQSGGKPVLTFFTPEGSDRAPARKPEDVPLEKALREAAEAEEAARNGDRRDPPPKAEHAEEDA